MRRVPTRRREVAPVITPTACKNGTYRYPFHRNDSCPIHPQCKLEHSVKILGQWKFAPSIALGKTLKVNGTTTWSVRCVGCGQSHAIKQHDANVLQARGYQVAFTILPTGTQDDVCCVKGCGRTDIELHHFAPRSIFPDADNWPVLPLCVACHLHWHNETGLAT